MKNDLTKYLEIREQMKTGDSLGYASNGGAFLANLVVLSLIIWEMIK